MKFTVTNDADQAIGTVDVTEEVYLDDDALLGVLADAGYVDRSEVLEIVEEIDNKIDIFEYETGGHRVSLVLIY